MRRSALHRGPMCFRRDLEGEGAFVPLRSPSRDQDKTDKIRPTPFTVPDVTQRYAEGDKWQSIGESNPSFQVENLAS